MKKPTKLEFYVNTFEDVSVGIYGRCIPINIYLPQEVWSEFDDEDTEENLKILKDALTTVIDPDGKTFTKKEKEDMELFWETIYNEINYGGKT